MASLPSPDRRRLMLIDDERVILRVLERVLPEHDLVAFQSAADALAQLQGAATKPDLILCDVLMPGTSGMELYAALHGRDPELASRIIFLTGGAATHSVAGFLNAVPNRRIEKPFAVEAVRSVVAEALNSPR